MTQSGATIDLSLVPPHRLGRLLAEARDRQGIDLKTIEASSKGQFALSELIAIETGNWLVHDDELGRLSVLYGIAVGELVPSRSRLVIDLEEGNIRIGKDRKRFTPDASPRHVMLRYLALISALRESQHQQLSLRDDDLYSLGTALRVGPGHVRRELIHLMSASTKEVQVLSQSFARRLAIPSLGLLVALTSVGGLLLVKAHDGRPNGSPTNVTESNQQRDNTR